MPSKQKKKTLPRYPTRLLPVEKLIPTPDNRRERITNASVESLAKSMKHDGVLQPIVVRPHPTEEGCWEIRAGERRWRAAKLAGLPHIPAIIRNIDDQAALTVTVAENLHRKDLHPLERAATIQLAFDRGHDIKAVAAGLGMSVAKVNRMASLTKLSQVWRDEVLRPDSDLSRFTVAHLELVARLPEATQVRLAEASFAAVLCRGFPSVEDMRRIIDRDLRSLVAMPWGLDDETLDPQAGPCTTCPKRSGMHPMLFDADDAPRNGKVSKSDRCLDPACYDGKLAAHVIRREAELRADHPNLRLVVLGTDPVPETVREITGGRHTTLYTPRIVKAGHDGAVPVMPVSGPRAGQLIHVQGPETTSTGRKHRAGVEEGQTQEGPAPLAERQARLQKRRDAFFVQKVAESLRGFNEGQARTTVAAMRSRKDHAARRFDPLALVLAFGTYTRSHRDTGSENWERYDALVSSKKRPTAELALAEVIGVWNARLSMQDRDRVGEQAADAKRVCQLLGIDADAIEAASISSIPTPKSWASDVETPPFVPTPAAREPTRGRSRR